MKLLVVGLVGLFVLGISATGFAEKTEKTQTFTGYILTTTCAGNNEVIAKNFMDAAVMCSEGAGQPRSTFFLYDPRTQMRYELANQKKATNYAGEDVNVTGYVDGASRMIHVRKINPIDSYYLLLN